MINKRNRAIEYVIAIASFITAVALAFTSLIISEAHEVAAGNCSLVAQFLLLTASIFGLDYKLNTYGKTSTSLNGNKIKETTTGTTKQQSPQP